MIMALASLAACPTLNENLYCFHRELGKSRHPHSFGSNVFTRWGLGKVWDTLINLFNNKIQPMLRSELSVVQAF